MSKIAVIGIAGESVFLKVGRKYILDAIPTKKEIENIGKKYE